MFTEEQKAELQKMIAAGVVEGIKSSNTAILEQVQEKLNGLDRSIASRIPQMIDERLKASDEKLKETLTPLESLKTLGNPDEWFSSKIDAYLEKLAEEAAKEEQASKGQEGRKPNEPDPELTAVRQELEQLRAQREKDQQEFRAAIKAEQDRQADLLRQSQLKDMRAAARQKISGLVHPGAEDDFLKLLEDKGILVEDGDNFVIKSKDNYGEVKLPLEQGVPDLLKNQFGYFVPPRPGTGTGSGPSSTSSAPPATQILKPELPAQDIYALAQDPANFDKMLQDLDSLAKV